MTKVTKTVKKAATKTTKKTVVLTMNQYDVPMIEIPNKTRPVFISVKKALAILETENDASLLVTETKYGRELTRVQYGDGKSFLVGLNKIEAVLAAKKLIVKAVA